MTLAHADSGKSRGYPNSSRPHRPDPGSDGNPAFRMGGDQRCEREPVDGRGARACERGLVEHAGSVHAPRQPDTRPSPSPPFSWPGRGRSSSATSIAPASRPRAVRALRAAHDRPGLRRPRRGPHRAGPRIPLGRALSRDPAVLREAVLAAEDKNFFSHAGVDFGAFPRVVWKALPHSFAASRRASERDGAPAPEVVFPQGGSTLTQQLVRGYFLRRRDEAARTRHAAAAAHLDRAAPGRPWWACPPPTSSAARWRRCGCRCGWRRRWQRRFGSQAGARRKRSWPATPASSTWATAATASPPPPSTTSASRSSAYTAGDADKAALLAGIAKSPRDYAPTPRTCERPLRRRNDMLRPDGEARVHLERELAEQCRRPPITLARAQHGQDGGARPRSRTSSMS